MIRVLATNLLLLVSATGAVLVATRPKVDRNRDASRRRSHRAIDLALGAIGALGVLALLFLIRRAASFAGLAVPQRSTAIGWIVAVAALEEAVKLNLVRSLRSPLSYREDHRRGIHRAIHRGWGFAVTEHLLYLPLQTSRFVVRLLLVGILHTATTIWYAWPHRPQRSRTIVSLLRFLIAVIAHSGFNFAMISLDTILTFY